MRATTGVICGVDVVELDDALAAGLIAASPGDRRCHLRLVWSPRRHIRRATRLEPVPETFYLSRAWVDGGRAPERLELAGLGARMPALASTESPGVRPHAQQRRRLHTLEPAPRPVLVSSFWDIQPQFSPDGSRLVFTSSRSGESLDIWLASADGSNAHQLTHGPGRSQGSPSWSPDRPSHRLRRQGRRWPPGRLDHRRRRRRPAPDHEGTRRPEHADVVPRRALDLLPPPTRVRRATPGGCPADGRISRACHARGERQFRSRVDGRQGPHLQARLRGSPLRPAACGRSRASAVAVRLG